MPEPSAQSVLTVLIFPASMHSHSCPQTVLCHQFADPALGGNYLSLWVSLLATSSANPQQRFGWAKRRGSIGPCSERYQRFAHDWAPAFLPKMKMTIISMPFCQVSSSYDPLRIQLTPCWSYSAVAQRAMDLQINGCHFQHCTPPSARDNKQSTSTLSNHSYHYTIECTESKTLAIFKVQWHPVKFIYSI